MPWAPRRQLALKPPLHPLAPPPTDWPPPPLHSLREYVSGKVEERVFPIACPIPSCKAPVATAECNLVLTPEEQDVLGKVGPGQGGGGG